MTTAIRRSPAQLPGATVLGARARLRASARPSALDALMGGARQRLRNWWCAWRRQALTLELDGRVVRFTGLTEFEFCLASRTQYPSRHLPALLERTPEELQRAADDIRHAEKRFAEILAAAMEAPSSLGARLANLEPAVFSNDHRWREIMTALARLPEAYDAFKRVAVARYLQYLHSRQVILLSIYQERCARRPCAGEAAAPEAPQRDEATAFAQTAAERAAPEGLLGHPGGALAPMARLPRGRTLRVRLPVRGSMPIHLSSQHAFRLEAGVPMHWIEEGAERYALGRRRYRVGRHRDNDIPIDPGYAEVSRAHLLLEPIDKHTVLLTDLSTHGTFVPQDNL